MTQAERNALLRRIAALLVRRHPDNDRIALTLRRRLDADDEAKGIRH